MGAAVFAVVFVPVMLIGGVVMEKVVWPRLPKEWQRKIEEGDF